MIHATTFLDPLYGRLELSPAETLLVFSPEVQRLRYVRLCNINSLLISGASEVTRFQHTLGVLRLVQEWLSVRGSSLPCSRVVTAAAILHDVMTAPFGHSIQYVLEEGAVAPTFSHDSLSSGHAAGYYQDISANASFCGEAFSGQRICGDKWSDVCELIQGLGPLGPLLAGSLDLDNLDNVIRLSYHTGIADRADAISALALARDMEPHGRDLLVSREGVETVVRWQAIRRRLYELLLLNWAEFSAKAMLTRAFEEAIPLGIVGDDTWRLTDDELLHAFDRAPAGEGQSIKHLSHRLKLGDLYFPIVLLRTSHTRPYAALARSDSKRAIEKLIRDAVYGRGAGRSILVHPILDKRKTDRSVAVAVRGTGQRLVLGSDSNSLLIGFFSSSAVDSNKERARLLNAIYHVLKDAGIDEWEELADPMPQSPKPLTQSKLFP